MTNSWWPGENYCTFFWALTCNKKFVVFCVPRRFLDQKKSAAKSFVLLLRCTRLTPSQTEKPKREKSIGSLVSFVLWFSLSHRVKKCTFKVEWRCDLALSLFFNFITIFAVFFATVCLCMFNLTACSICHHYPAREGREDDDEHSSVFYLLCNPRPLSLSLSQQMSSVTEFGNCSSFLPSPLPAIFLINIFFLLLV